MANGLTPAIQSGDTARLKMELATVLLALRRLRADFASGRLERDRQFLSIGEIDELLETLCPQRPQLAAVSRPRPQTPEERSASSWNALAQAVG